MSSINDNGIYTSIYQCLHSVDGIISNAHTSSYAQTTFLILASHWFIFRLGNVFIGNQTNQLVVLINYWQLLNLILLKNLRRSFKVGSRMCGDNMITCHYLINMLIQTPLKA